METVMKGQSYLGAVGPSDMDTSPSREAFELEWQADVTLAHQSQGRDRLVTLRGCVGGSELGDWAEFSGQCGEADRWNVEGRVVRGILISHGTELLHNRFSFCSYSCWTAIILEVSPAQFREFGGGVGGASSQVSLGTDKYS